MINYPNGLTYHPNNDKNNSLFQGKSPKKFSYQNRGMTLETMINASIDYYRHTNRAIIHKKPTPIQIVHVDYPKRSAATITEAYFKQSSTTDYNGIYRGFYLDFEAKETTQTTRFPLSNFHSHQIKHMRQCHDQHGIIFVLVYFSTLRNIYLLEASHLFKYWDDQVITGKKSIPLSYFKKHGIPIHISYSPQIPFLDAVDQLIQSV